jgi:hypothetical protein
LIAKNNVAFVPTKDYITIKDGKEWKRRIPVFGGYIFVAYDVSDYECWETVKPLIKEDKLFRGLLAYDFYKTKVSGDHVVSLALAETEKAPLLVLTDKRESGYDNSGVRT